MCAQSTTVNPEQSSSEIKGSIKSVSVISTGSADVHPEHIFGTRKPSLWWVFTSKRWVQIPIYVFIIEHSQGLVLFDAGMDRAVMTNPDFFPDKVTKYIFSHVFRFHQGPEETLTRQLELAGFRVGDVQKAAISHLHWDHVGGIREIPQAELVASHTLNCKLLILLALLGAFVAKFAGHCTTKSYYCRKED